MNAREREQLDQHITGNYGEEPQDDDVRENVAVTLDTADLHQLLDAARRRAEKEHTEVGEEMLKLEERLKDLKERDAELTEICNRLADATEAPLKVIPLPNVGEIDLRMEIVGIMKVKEGRYLPASIIHDLLTDATDDATFTLAETIRILKRGKKDEIFQYKHTKGWLLTAKGHSL